MSKQSDLISVSQGAAGDPLFIDTVNDRVGVGTSSPVSKLQVNGGNADNNNNANTIVATGTNHVRLKVHTPTTGGYRASLVLSSNEAVTATGNEVSISTTGSDEMQFATAGTERMRIDTAGRVTMPYQPAFQTNGAGYSLVANEIYAIRPSALFNTGGHYNVVNGRFTAPVTGKYKFHFLFTTATSGAAAPSLYFRRNGSGAHGRVLNYYAQYSSTSAHVVFDLNAGDFVEAIIEPWNSAAVVVWETSWGGYLIG